MCGLSGCCGDVSSKEEDAVKDLLIFNTVRGDDSTGLAAVNRGSKSISVVKEVGPFPNLFDRKKFDKLFHGVNLTYIGHNRSATVGANTHKNAHPFNMGNIVGAHNGSIDYQNKNRMQDGGSFGTDSEAIFNNIEVNGIDDTIGKLDDSEAWALTWYNVKENTINFIRNSKRPLVYVYVNDHRTIFWASEYEILACALYRRGFKPEGKFIWLPENKLHTWEIPDSSMKKFGDPIVRTLSGRDKDYWKKNQQSWFNKHKEDKDSSPFPIATGTSRGDTATQSDRLDDDLESDMVYGGLYVGMVPNPNKDTNSNMATGAKSALNLAADKAKATIAEKAASRVMTGMDIVRKKAEEELLKTITPNPSKFPLIVHTKTLRIYRDIVEQNWIVYEYDPVRAEWPRSVVQEMPRNAPFHVLDINARHQFHHNKKGFRNGRGKWEKLITYKGYSGRLLNQEEFAEYMKKGCLNCDRHPEWGNEVTFLNPDHVFLCEYCGMDATLKKSMLEMSKSCGTEKRAA